MCGNFFCPTHGNGMPCARRLKTHRRVTSVSFALAVEKARSSVFCCCSQEVNHIARTLRQASVNFTHLAGRIPENKVAYRSKAFPDVVNGSAVVAKVIADWFVGSIDTRNGGRVINLVATFVDRPGPVLPCSNKSIESFLDTVSLCCEPFEDNGTFARIRNGVGSKNSQAVD